MSKVIKASKHDLPYAKEFFNNLLYDYIAGYVKDGIALKDVQKHFSNVKPSQVKTIYQSIQAILSVN